MFLSLHKPKTVFFVIIVAVNNLSRRTTFKGVRLKKLKTNFIRVLGTNDIFKVLKKSLK